MLQVARRRARPGERPSPTTHGARLVKTEGDFVPLVHARDTIDLGMTQELLESEGIPHVVDASDRYEMLQVLEGGSAQGLQYVLVPRSRFEQALALLEEAWGPEQLAAKRIMARDAG